MLWAPTIQQLRDESGQTLHKEETEAELKQSQTDIDTTLNTLFGITETHDTKEPSSVDIKDLMFEVDGSQAQEDEGSQSTQLLSSSDA